MERRDAKWRLYPLGDCQRLFFAIHPGTAMAMNYGGDVGITFHVVDKVPNFNFYPVSPNSIRGVEVVQYSMAF